MRGIDTSTPQPQRYKLPPGAYGETQPGKSAPSYYVLEGVSSLKAAQKIIENIVGSVEVVKVKDFLDTYVTCEFQKNGDTIATWAKRDGINFPSHYWH